MIKKCKNCLKAYNSPNDNIVRCWHKEFVVQYKNIDISVKPDETCERWESRQLTLL